MAINAMDFTFDFNGAEIEVGVERNGVGVFSTGSICMPFRVNDQHQIIYSAVVETHPVMVALQAQLTARKG